MTRKTAVHITIDTESSMGGAWAHADREPLPAPQHVFCKSTEGDLGLPLIVNELDRCGMKATFFLETLAGHVLGEDDTKSIADFLLGKGQDVQLHIHPTFRHYRDYQRQKEAGNAPENPRETDQLSGHDAAEQLDLLRDGAEMFERATGYWPQAFRAGGFAANLESLKALHQLGIPIDSSYNPIYRDSNMSFDDTQLVSNKVAKVEGVWEMPITVGQTLLPEGVGLKHADPTCISSAEIERILNQAHEAGMRNVMSIFHCFSTVKPRDIFYSSMRPNWVVIRRLRRFLDFLAINQDRFEVVTMGEVAADLTQLEGEQPATVPDLGFLIPATRKIVQAVNNLYWI